MGDKNSDGGQFFTPRTVIKTMITAIDPVARKTFYDPCCGTGGFLAETYKYLYGKGKLTSSDIEYLSESAFWGKDNSDSVFAITLANLVVHGINMPHISNENTITGQITYDGLASGSPAQYDYIFTNPPFGGKENIELIKGTGFAYKTSNTQILFIQHVIDKLKK
jgi:type I restriction enzyme M protein